MYLGYVVDFCGGMWMKNIVVVFGFFVVLMCGDVVFGGVVYVVGMDLYF